MNAREYLDANPHRFVAPVWQCNCGWCIRALTRSRRATRRAAKLIPRLQDMGAVVDKERVLDMMRQASVRIE